MSADRVFAAAAEAERRGWQVDVDRFDTRDEVTFAGAVRWFTARVDRDGSVDVHTFDDATQEYAASTVNELERCVNAARNRERGRALARAVGAHQAWQASR